MAESAKRRSCFQSLNLDGEGFFLATILVIMLQLLRRSSNSGYRHDLDQVLRQAWAGRPSSRRRWGSTTSNVALETRGRRWGSLSCQTWSRWPCWCWFRWFYDAVGYWGVCQVQCRRKTCLTKVPAMIQPLLYWLAECTPVTRLKCKSFWAPET